MSAPSDPLVLPPFLERRRAALAPDLCFDRFDGDAATWRASLLALWRRDLPPHGDCPSGLVEDDRITLTFPTGARASGRFVLPRGTGPHPAVLLLHEHGGMFDTGWQKLFDVPASQDTRNRLYSGQTPADVFVQAGFAVLCLDALGFGARPCGGGAGQQALAAAAMGLGWTLAGITAAEDIGAAQWLAAHPQIDSRRIGAFGFSFGGFRAWQVAALSDHIGAAVSVGWMAERAAMMRQGAPLLRGHSAYQFLYPSLGGRADFPDMAGTGAHKPLMFRSGANDPHMPDDSARAAWAKIARIAAATGGPAPDTAMHPHAHTCPAGVLQDAARFLHRSL